MNGTSKEFRVTDDAASIADYDALAESLGAVLDKHVGWQMHRGAMIADLCRAVERHQRGSSA